MRWINFLGCPVPASFSYSDVRVDGAAHKAAAELAVSRSFAGLDQKSLKECTQKL
jgi:hypothetical protein